MLDWETADWGTQAHDLTKVGPAAYHAMLQVEGFDGGFATGPCAAAAGRVLRDIVAIDWTELRLAKSGQWVERAIARLTGNASIGAAILEELARALTIRLRRSRPSPSA